MRAWIATAIVACTTHGAAGQIHKVFKSVEIDVRLEKLQQPAIIYQGTNFTVSLNAQSGLPVRLKKIAVQTR